MKISVSYPPLENPCGVPLLSQNRQFQWFRHPTYIYPMVPASAATLLKQNGYDVSWDDAIAEELTMEQYLDRLERQQPDIVAMETKTPVVKAHWKIVERIKERLPNVRVVMAGDHVTAMPAETMENSHTDFILTGGDHDFLLLNLCNHLERGEQLEPGIWYREDGAVRNTGKFELNHDLNVLPFVDRELTKWQLYSEKNGNYKQLPGTYTMVARDCWWHRCTFCSWTTLYPGYRTRTPQSLLDEIGGLIDNLGVKSVFDDSGTFPTGQWLKDFCEGMIERGYNRKIEMGCNMRFGALDEAGYRLMKKANFRYLLFGLESARQDTLDRIDKGLRVADVTEGCRMAKRAGLEPHLTLMVGYPWESREDVTQTVELAKSIFKKGHADTLQATIVIPYPGTPLYDYCVANDLLNTQDWDKYDMRQAIMKNDLPDTVLKDANQQLYKVFFSPGYIWRKLTSIRSGSDIKFIGRGIRAIFGHLRDFAN